MLMLEVLNSSYKPEEEEKGTHSYSKSSQTLGPFCFWGLLLFRFKNCKPSCEKRDKNRE